jgi:hypothetical protein
MAFDLEWNTTMDLRKLSLQMVILGAVSVALVSAGCKDPFPPKTTTISVDGLEDCAASDTWLPNTPAVTMFDPAPHPTTECPFYRGVWQNFLIATQPIDAAGTPALFNFPTMDTLFDHVPAPDPTVKRAYLGDIKQAGGRQILVDQNGHTLYYGLHGSQTFADFLRANHLATAKEVQGYAKDPVKQNLTFPPGIVEFKEAWQEVDGTADQIAAQTANFISMKTTVPTLRQVTAMDSNGNPTTSIVEDRNTPREVTVRLLAIHVVYTYPGHPEFIWGSLEHTNVNVANGESDTKAADGHRDLAPVIGEGSEDVQNPSSTDPNNANNHTVVSTMDFILYKGGTQASDGNAAIEEKDLVLDPVNQTFTKAGGASAAASIYRMFPASKSNETHPDDAITSLNHNVEALFKMTQLPANDKRAFYRLVGGQWMDKPRYYHNDFVIQNDKTSPFVTGPFTDQEGVMHPQPLTLTAFTDAIKANGSDSEFSILAGEDRMSSTAMESFTQGPASFNNCFTCHNTQAVTAKGVPFDIDKGTGAIQLLQPGLLNVSHLMSEIVLEDCTAPANLQDNGNGTFTAICP